MKIKALHARGSLQRFKWGKFLTQIHYNAKRQSRKRRPWRLWAYQERLEISTSKAVFEEVMKPTLKIAEYLKIVKWRIGNGVIY